MAVWIYFIFLGVFLSGICACPFNCDCTKFKSVCSVIFESDELDLDAELLGVKGVLKARHYLQLDDRPSMKKELHDCSCRSLMNCE